MTSRVLRSQLRSRMFALAIAATAGLPACASAGFITFSSHLSKHQTGSGLGSTHHILELQDTGGESGAITWNGTADVATTTDVKVPHSNTRTFQDLLDLGLQAAATAAGVQGFSVLFNVTEPDGLATLQDLALMFYAPNGTLATQIDGDGVIDYTGPDLTLGDDGGVGQAGWDFEVRFTNAEWAFFTDPANANYRLGMSATIAGTAGAPENFFVNPAAVPEPSSWALLGLVGGAGALGRFVRRRKAKADA